MTRVVWMLDSDTPDSIEVGLRRVSDRDVLPYFTIQDEHGRPHRVRRGQRVRVRTSGWGSNLKDYEGVIQDIYYEGLRLTSRMVIVVKLDSGDELWIYDRSNLVWLGDRGSRPPRSTSMQEQFIRDARGKLHDLQTGQRVRLFAGSLNQCDGVVQDILYSGPAYDKKWDAVIVKCDNGATLKIYNLRDIMLLSDKKKAKQQ